MSKQNIVFTTRTTTAFKTKEIRQESINQFVNAVSDVNAVSVDVLARVTHSDGRVDLHHYYADKNQGIHTLQGHGNSSLQGIANELDQVIGRIEHPLIQTNHESFFKIKEAPVLDLKDANVIHH